MTSDPEPARAAAQTPHPQDREVRDPHGHVIPGTEVREDPDLEGRSIADVTRSVEDDLPARRSGTEVSR